MAYDNPATPIGYSVVKSSAVHTTNANYTYGHFLFKAAGGDESGYIFSTSEGLSDLFPRFTFTVTDNQFLSNAYLLRAVVYLGGSATISEIMDTPVTKAKWLSGENNWIGGGQIEIYASQSVQFILYQKNLNKSPTLTLNTPSNVTLYENDTFPIVGSTTDTDVDDVVTVKYQIDSGTVRNLHSAVSNGSPIDFAKTLSYTDGALKDGNTVLTSALDKDVPHTVSVWAEDGKGGKSNIITRTFFVVPNRPPSVTINPIASQSDLINSNVINVSGAVADLDNNDVTVVFSINGGEEQQVHQGPPSSFTFNIMLNDLKVGANTVIVKATDIYDTSGTKTLTINKTHNAVPINKAVAMYQIMAPTGSAKSILLWITRTLGPLGITAEVSLTNAGEAENYVPLAETNTGITNGLRQDEFAYEGTVDKEKIILKITYDRTDASVIDTIKQISGVLF